MGLDLKRRQQKTTRRGTAVGGAQSVEKKYEWRAPNRLLVVQTGVSASQAMVFKALAAPQGLCENLINALKLLANQQKDGDSPIQSIATGHCETSRKGIMEGPGNFIKVDNHCAFDVGHLSEGARPFPVRRPKFKEGGPSGVDQGGSRGIDAKGRGSGLQEIVHQCRSHSGGLAETALGWC